MTDTLATPPPPGPRYEFTAPQNATMAHLAVTMRFVGFANVLLGLVLGAGVVSLWTVTIRGSVIIAVLAVLIVVIGLYLVGAARHFTRIAATEGSDIDNLMVALDELKNVYAVQRWIFVAAVLAVSLALMMTVTLS